MDNLRTLSVSPWCDMSKLAAIIDRPLNLACKPSPAYISQGFEADLLQAHARQVRDCFRGHTVEYVMKDVHTIEGDISRITRWIDIARTTLS